MIDYASQNGIAVRHPSTKFTGALGAGRDASAISAIRTAGIKTTDYFLIHVGINSRERLYDLVTGELSGIQDNSVVELGLHPGYVSDELRSLSSLVEGREVDTAFAMSPQIQTWLEEHDIELIGYGDV